MAALNAEKPELLAPAGNWECARAAVASGADAIFFGLSSFNARLRADNFTDQDLPELMAYLHRYGVKGYVTMNTLIFTNELEAAERQLKWLDECGVDAVIIQDLGLAKLCKTVAPNVELHASTQMTITSPEGLNFINRLTPLDTAVLSRELSVREIERFQKAGCEVPLEVFVHGALCVAYSGQCLTSESLGQRSANRGECAQACRMPYSLVVDGEEREMGEVRYLLSPQDLAAVDMVPDLVQAGVKSLKIEGRLKSPEYVAAVTSVYRKAIDSVMVTEHDRYALEMTFSRGLSNGWLAGTNHPGLTHGRFGKKRGAFQGVVVSSGRGWVQLDGEQVIPLKPGDGLVIDAGQDRNEEQGGRLWKVEGRKLYFHKTSQIDWDSVRAGQQLWKTSDPALENEIRSGWRSKRPVAQRELLNVTVEGGAGEPLRVRARGIEVASDALLEEAKSAGLSVEKVTQTLGKLGETSFQLGEVNFQVKGDVFLPASQLNLLRRDLVARLEETLERKERRAPSGALTDLMPRVELAESKPKLAVLCRTLDQLEAAIAARDCTIYCDFEDPRRYKDAVDRVRTGTQEIYLATPRIQKPQELGYFKLIANAKPDGVLIRNPGAITYYQDSGLKMIGDFSLNVANPLSAKLLMDSAPFQRLTISYDLNISQVLDLMGAVPSEWMEITLHQHMPMFHMEHCVFCTFLSEGTSYRDCGRPCEEHVVHLKDRVGQMHRLHADVGCRNTLFNGKAQTGARFYSQMRAAGLSRFRLELLDETQEEAAETIFQYQAMMDGRQSAEELLEVLPALEKLGVTEGTLV